MTGRMELETKYSNNINHLLMKEPGYMKNFDTYMASDGKTAKTRMNYISNVLRFIHYLRETGTLIETETDFNTLGIVNVRNYIQLDDSRVIEEKGRISDSYKCRSCGRRRTHIGLENGTGIFLRRNAYSHSRIAFCNCTGQSCGSRRKHSCKETAGNV